MTKEELERRRPLWSAMSDLFLDTEVRWNVPWVALAAARSGYDDETLERIFWVEVFPEAIFNLQSVAGEWAMLELDEAALVRRATQGTVPWLERRATGWMVEREWQAARALVPWLTGPEGPARRRALDLLGNRYFEEPTGSNRLATPEEARKLSPALLDEAWARYEPLCRGMLLDVDQGSHDARAAAVRALLAASR